ncbi:MAG: phosphonate C-P lyase system protein PhnH [Alphaproteobacteria bacterium]|nr:phosphonate C-P lyase system protein PhnH [Alphaproteobacteria bacterium]
MSAVASQDVFRGGFANPDFDAQMVFRQIMNALARPGTVCMIDAFTEPPAPLSPCTGAIAATLFDADTEIWLDPLLLERQEVVGWLTFQTAAPLAETGFDARFALVSSGDLLPPLERFAQGTQEYPDRSTTIILQLDSLEGGVPLVLAGPGIKDRHVIEPVGLPPRFVEQWAANNSHYPRGVDIILVADDGLIGLPRTTRIEPTDGQEA